MSIMKGLDNFVQLDPVPHKYYDRKGQEYESVSKFLARFYEPFNAHFASKGDKTLQAEWKRYGTERADIGTAIHNSLELYSNEMKILPENEHLRPAIVAITSEYNYAYKSFNEQCLYHTPSLVAGTCDKLILTSAHPNAPLDLDDFKTNLGGLPQVDLKKDGSRNHKYMLHCCSHLIESKYNKYSLQLSIYAYFLEQKTGRRIGRLRIMYIDPTNPMNYYPIPVNYQRGLVQEMLIHKQVEDAKPKVIKVTSEEPAFELEEEL